MTTGTRGLWAIRHRGEARLRLLRQPSEYHRDVIAGVPVAGAGDDDPRAMDPSDVARRLQRERHLGPLGERRDAAKLHAILVDDDRVGGEAQAGLPCFDGNFRERTSRLNFARAHTAPSE